MKTVHLLGTPLQVTDHREWTEFCQRRAKEPGVTTVDFTNTQIVALRKSDPEFRRATDSMDYFVPDSTPLKWCLNAGGARMKDRLYGPDFLRHCVVASPRPIKHYFLGGSDECLQNLRANLTKWQPDLAVVKWRNGYFRPEESAAIVEEINEFSPDFIWVGLGTPKQQYWISEWKESIKRGVVFAVGFAFDANAGTKKDSPRWMQRVGMGWFYRAMTEPRRLLLRYAKYNTLFMGYLALGVLRGDVFSAPGPGRN